MEFKLKNYENEIKTFNIELPLSSMNLTIVYTIQSGDEVVYIYHFNELIAKCDSDENRLSNFLDKIKLITREELEALNNE